MCGHAPRRRSTGVLARAFTAAVLSGAAATVVVLPVGLGGATAHAAPGDTTRFVALPSPTRLLDTRDAGTPVPAGGTVSVRVAGASPLPAIETTRAAVLNITVVGTAGVGFWTAFPHGSPMPTASNLNVDERWSLLGDGLAIPNLVTVPVGTDGLVDVFSQTGGHLVVDMLGTYELSGATSAGRFQPLARPQRVLDTREFLTLSPTRRASK